MLRRILVVPVLSILAACQPQQPPKTAVLAPPQGSIDLPAPETAHRYDTAIKPGDETRASGKIAVVRSAPRPPVDALTEREKAAIARWDREEATLNYDAPPLGLRPPPRTAVGLAMPTNAALPRPAAEKAAPATRNAAALPPPIERAAPVEPPVAAEPARAIAPVPPPPALPAAEPAPAGAPPPVESAAPTETAAAAPPPAAAAPLPAEKPLPRPGGEPAAVITFAPRAADVSDGNRLLLERFAKDANVRRVRQILLFGFAGGGDPVEARKLALARVLAVHAALIDQGLKANIEIGDFSQANDGLPDRVDVMLR